MSPISELWRLRSSVRSPSFSRDIRPILTSFCIGGGFLCAVVLVHTVQCRRRRSEPCPIMWRLGYGFGRFPVTYGRGKCQKNTGGILRAIPFLLDASGSNRG